MKTIIPKRREEHLADAVSVFKAAKRVAALTGAGISVASGIPDFRSPGGLWSMYAPEEYATLKVFQKSPEKAWQLYRELGKVLLDKQPSKAHYVLKKFEEDRRLAGIVTQNVDNLHQLAGNKRVFEIHGDHQHLQCLNCGQVEVACKEHYTMGEVPTCDLCGSALKPNVVLFGESVRVLDKITTFIYDCDLLLVVGTSAQVYPAAQLPFMVKQRGGSIYEFNMEPALASGVSNFFFDGDLGITLPAFYNAFLES